MIPFIIGVTGHRRLDADAVATIARNVRLQLAEFQRRMPNTPMVLVSALAEGADRLAADVALDLGFELWCVLPTLAEEYEKDFASEESLADFRRLKTAAKRVLNASTLAERMPNASSRPQIYVDAGDEICRLSYVLLAIWDGKGSDLLGGTAYVINTFRLGRFVGATRSGLSVPDCGMVVHVHANVKESVDSRHGVSHLAPLQLADGKRLFPGGEKAMKQHYANGIRDLETFNQNIKSGANKVEQAASELLPLNFRWRLDEVLANWLEVYVMADAASLEAERRRRGSLLLVIGLFVLFTLASLLYGGVVTEVWPLAVGVGLLAVSFGVYRRQRRTFDDETWVGSRALAEFLRVAITWRACGLRDAIHPSIADEQIFPMDWLGMVTRWIDNQNRLLPAAAVTDEMSALVADGWIKGQLNYFSDGANKIAHHGAHARSYAMASGVSIVLALALYVSTIAIDVALSSQGREHALGVTAWTMYGYWGLLSVAAVIAAFSGIMAHAEHETEYSHALIKFRIARIRLHQVDHKACLVILASLGRGALQETANWLRLHRTRPLRMPF